MWRASSNLAPTHTSVPIGGTQAGLNADLGGEGAVLGGICGCSSVTQAPETWLTGPGFVRWGGATGGTRNRDELAVEDLYALFDTVADP